MHLHGFLGVLGALGETNHLPLSLAKSAKLAKGSVIPAQAGIQFTREPVMPAHAVRWTWIFCESSSHQASRAEMHPTAGLLVAPERLKTLDSRMRGNDGA